MKRAFFFRTDEINPDGIAPFREPYWERRHPRRRAFLSTTATRRQGCRRSQCVEDQPQRVAFPSAAAGAVAHSRAPIIRRVKRTKQNDLKMKTNQILNAKLSVNPLFGVHPSGCRSRANTLKRGHQTAALR